ncbi:hypothetical protein ACHAWF_010536, partial [Thalassiosira exigua]
LLRQIREQTSSIDRTNVARGTTNDGSALPNAPPRILPLLRRRRRTRAMVIPRGVLLRRGRLGGRIRERLALPLAGVRLRGGGFFVPYVLALIFVGVLVLVLEIALGQYYQTGGRSAVVVGWDLLVRPPRQCRWHRPSRSNRRLTNWCFPFVVRRRRRGRVREHPPADAWRRCVSLVTYYSMLLSWVTGAEAKGYFYNTIIGMSTLGADLRPTRLVLPNVGYSASVWFSIFVCTVFGVKWTGRIASFTMGLPIAILFIFLGRSVSLEGASDGIQVYIMNSNWKVLTETPQVWAQAVTQIFFSLSVTFGIMTAYGSHCKKDEPAFLNSCVVAFANCLFIFVAGFAVFATLGHLAHIGGHENISDLQYKSFGLVFGSWPVALGTLPGGENWIRLLFVMLFFLGIVSAFSFTASVITVMKDTRLLQNANRKLLCVFVIVTGFAMSLMYATDASLIFLDTIDYYINFVMLLVGGFECFSAGWVYNIQDQIDILGPRIVVSYIFTTFGSMAVACGLWFGLGIDEAIWIGFIGLVGSYALGMAFVTHLMRKKKNADLASLDWKDMFYTLMMENVMQLRNDLSQVVGFLPKTWAFLVKHFISPIIMVLFGLDASAKLKDGDGNVITDAEGNPLRKFGNYEGYVTWPYQALGMAIVAFVGFLFLTSLAFPWMYDALQIPAEDEDSEEKIFKTNSYKAKNSPKNSPDEAANYEFRYNASEVEAKEVESSEVMPSDEDFA